MTHQLQPTGTPINDVYKHQLRKKMENINRRTNMQLYDQTYKTTHAVI